MNPLVSIITPSYNQGRFIRATIESVLSQDYPAIEYIVMDGGSKDETVDILRSYGERIRWVSERDKGQTDAINKGLKVARGEFVAYLNSDDVYLPGTVRAVIEAFQRDPEVGLVYGDSHAIDADGRLIDEIKTIPHDPDILIYDANYICQPASFYRRSMLDSIGSFDVGLHFLMDYEFFLRASSRGVKFQMLPRALAAIRYHGDCKTLSDGVYPWKDERRTIIGNYARQAGAEPTRARAWLYRAKRYARLIARGRLDFANVKLARRLRQIA